MINAGKNWQILASLFCVFAWRVGFKYLWINIDTFEQLPKPLQAWDAKLKMCTEMRFLVEKKGLIIDETSKNRRYTAQLWGTTEVAAEDAVIVFYRISYDDAGNVTDCDWNFVERAEFDKTYSIIG